MAETVDIRLGERSYQIVIASDAMSGVAAHVDRWLESRFPTSGRPRQVLLVVDRNVARLHGRVVEQSFHGSRWHTACVELEPGEQTKSVIVVSHLYDRLIEIQADRRTLVVAVGGGVTGDTAGFAAATYARGIPFVQVPTTLLAQVDSSVGGKTGVNHLRGKNLIGAFHQPIGVFIDTHTLSTLPDREYRSGLAEVVKYGVILDSDFFDYLENYCDALAARQPPVIRHVVARSCRLKADVVERDEHETSGLRVVLNYGHTFAHAFEALVGYGELLHGEAVSIGMACAARLARMRGLADDSLLERQESLLTRLGLPTVLPETAKFSADDVITAMKLDKKTSGGQLRFVLPKAIGHVEVFDDIPDEIVRDLFN